LVVESEVGRTDVGPRQGREGSEAV
jgi:hypothetical protein